MDQSSLLIKRIFDLSLATISLTALFPLFLTTAILIKLTSTGPVFFKQARVGKGLRLFDMYKFRTMVVDAERKKDNLLVCNERQGPFFKMKNDPRVTKVGKLLRKYSIDELPQLVNILLGDMSFVGPRPPLPREVDSFQDWHRMKFCALPGLTCYWQIDKNSNMSLDEWIESDIRYCFTRNFFLDVSLILKTIPVVVRGRH